MGEIISKITTYSSSSSSYGQPTSSDPSFLGGATGSTTGGCNQKLGCGSTSPSPVYYPPTYPEPTPIAQPAPAPAPTYTNPVGAPVIDPGLPITSGSPDTSFIDLVSSPVGAIIDPISNVLGSILDLGGFGTQQEQVGGLMGDRQTVGNFGDFQSFDEQLANRELAPRGGFSFAPIIVLGAIGIITYLVYSKWG